MALCFNFVSNGTLYNNKNDEFLAFVLHDLFKLSQMCVPGAVKLLGTVGSILSRIMNDSAEFCPTDLFYHLDKSRGLCRGPTPCP